MGSVLDVVVYPSGEGVTTTVAPHMMVAACSHHGRSARRNLGPEAGPRDNPQDYPSALYLLAPYPKGSITSQCSNMSLWKTYCIQTIIDANSGLIS